MPQTDPKSAVFKVTKGVTNIKPPKINGFITQTDDPEPEDTDYSDEAVELIKQGFIGKIGRIRKKTREEILEDKLEKLEPGTVEYRNTYLELYIERAGGRNTREAVVAAARYLSEQEPDLPYFWGGKHLDIGVDPHWYQNSEIWSEGSDAQPLGSYWPDGLDCSGFCGWALRQGGFNMRGLGTGSYQGISSLKSYTIDNLMNAKEGDFLLSGGHIAIITYIDPEKGTITVAEEYNAAEGMKVTETTIADFFYSRGGFTWIVDMDAYYANYDNTIDATMQNILNNMGVSEISADTLHTYVEQAREYDFTSVGCQTVYAYLASHYGVDAAKEFAASIDHHVESGELISLAQQKFPDLNASLLESLIDQYIRIH